MREIRENVEEEKKQGAKKEGRIGLTQRCKKS